MKIWKLHRSYFWNTRYIYVDMWTEMYKKYNFFFFLVTVYGMTYEGKNN